LVASHTENLQDSNPGLNCIVEAEKGVCNPSSRSVNERFK